MTDKLTLKQKYLENKTQNDLDIEMLQLEVLLLKNECASLQAQINAVAKYLDSVLMVVKDLNAIIHQKETI
jgi:hypothetical protein